MKGFKYILPVSFTIAIFIVILASLVTTNQIEKREKERVRNYLNTIVLTTHQGFQSWADRNKKNCEVWAREMTPLIKQLLEVPATKELLLESPIQEEIRERLMPFYAGDDYEGFFVINSENISIASSRNENTGTTNLLVNHKDVFGKMWSGETVLTMPMLSDVPLPDGDSVLVANRATMFVGTPVKDELGNVIALFTFRINPADDFTAIFENARMGETGETYCVNAEGKMMSDSRFKSGLINKHKIIPGTNAILNLYITNPQKKSGDKEQELTEMARSLTNKKSESNLDGYFNYLGTEVVGAWIWDDEYDFGIASEMNKEEAFKGIRNIRLTTAILTLIILFLLTGLLLLFQRANKGISKSERKYRLFYESSPLGIYQITPDGKILSANPALVQMLGYRSFKELQNEGEKIDAANINSKLLNGNINKNGTEKNLIRGIEEKWKTKEGETIHIRENIRIVKGGDDVVAYFEGFVEDITVKKIANQKIQKLNIELEEKVRKRTRELEAINASLQIEMATRKSAEERSRMIFESSPYSIMLVDSTGKINLANSISEEYFGFSNTELIGASINTIFPDESDLQDTAGSRPAFLNPKEQNEEWNEKDIEACRKDGSFFPVELNLIPFDFEEEMMTLIIVIDITSRKEAEKKIKKAKLEAENANQAKSEFLSRMSHEFRTPMNSILGFAQLLNMGKLNPKYKKNVKQILKNGAHLLELINEVLDIARIEANRISLSMEAIKISTVISETIDILGPLAQERMVTFETEKTNFFVIADYQRIKQVFLNLLNNAIKYNIPDGFVKVSCELVAQNSGNTAGRVRINIKDSGKGISEPDLKKIFEPFERVGADLAEIEGSGLGLVIVKILVDAMKGQMGVVSKLGEGSTFWVELPLADNPVEQIQDTGKADEKQEMPSLKSGNLLYIEDNASNIDLMSQVLSDYRPSIRLITNTYGKNTLQLTKDYKPFLILLDLNLPDIHGLDVVKELKADTETSFVPIVVVSADAMETQMKRLIKEGVESYLTKPIDINQLLEIIDKKLG
ncbi:hybrid sensor histidine kinase/response regulator [Maribellus maritimus]|uniref:hybrid sensor histidine kinase/response regulator n=1 Tax=Maribellus maritimus TaxID=2870838 RepID=UPI001EE9CF98|nr:PAS domain S-box protein [Maribellus maritimus]MCG6189354.1 PAS domain S-box protein [Maribellus maritimus]